MTRDAALPIIEGDDLTLDLSRLQLEDHDDTASSQQLISGYSMNLEPKVYRDLMLAKRLMQPLLKSDSIKRSGYILEDLHNKNHVKYGVSQNPDGRAGNIASIYQFKPGRIYQTIPMRAAHMVEQICLILTWELHAFRESEKHPNNREFRRLRLDAAKEFLVVVAAFFLSKFDDIYAYDPSTETYLPNDAMKELVMTFKSSSKTGNPMRWQELLHSDYQGQVLKSLHAEQVQCSPSNPEPFAPVGDVEKSTRPSRLSRTDAKQPVSNAECSKRSPEFESKDSSDPNSQDTGSSLANHSPSEKLSLHSGHNGRILRARDKLQGNELITHNREDAQTDGADDGCLGEMVQSFSAKAHHDIPKSTTKMAEVVPKTPNPTRFREIVHLSKESLPNAIISPEPADTAEGDFRRRPAVPDLAGPTFPLTRQVPDPVSANDNIAPAGTDSDAPVPVPPEAGRTSSLRKVRKIFDINRTKRRWDERHPRCNTAIALPVTFSEFCHVTAGRRYTAAGRAEAEVPERVLGEVSVQMDDMTDGFFIETMAALERIKPT